MKTFSSLAAVAVIALALGAPPASAQSSAAPPAAPALAPAAPATSTPVDTTPAPTPALATPALATPALATPAPEAPVANPYGLGALWNNGDAIARGTLVVLAIMSASTWYILVTKLIEQTQLFGQAKRANKTFWKAASVHEGVETLPAKSPFRTVARTGIDALEHHEGSLVESIDLNTWVTLSIQRAAERIVSRLQGGLAVLATVGSTAPFIGLFGTVWGIYHALVAIGIAGQASIDKVAGPVGEALIMTALGLAVAVPAVLGYNFLVRRNKVAVESIRGFANDLHSLLVSGKFLARPAAPAPRAEQLARAA